MSTTISLGRRAAAAVRISRTAIAMATAAIGTVATVAGLAVGSDTLLYLSATAALAAIHALDRKGGAR